MRNRFVLSALTGILSMVVSGAYAQAPTVPTVGPAIYLQDNLDEADGLGYCIDTVTRFFNEDLHAHSCKPRGEDVLFRYDAGSGEILSATFENKCVSVSTAVKTGDPLSLLDCTGGEEQRFGYDETTLELRVGLSPDLCIVAGPESRQAGPFMARDLLVGDCERTAPSLKQWLIKAAE